LNNNNPVNPSDTEWLYWEALPWIDVNNQHALDTLRLFIERFPNYRPLVPSALNYTLEVVDDITSGDTTNAYFQTWIDEYNWLASIYTLDTASWYQSYVLLSMADGEDMFDRNGSANLSWNLERIFPFTYSTDSDAIQEIRQYQHRIPEDTTPYHVIPIPPQPYASSGVARSHPQSGLGFTEMPNPVSKTLQVDITAPYETPISLILFDELGRSVRQLSAGRVKAGDNLLNFDISDIPKGSYYLRLAAAEQVKTLRVVKE
jgi:hypothetical protein